MIRDNFSAIILCFIFIVLNNVKILAKSIEYGSETESITIVNGSNTIFRFHEDVKTISQASKFDIGPADSKDPNYSVLSVKPRVKRGKSKVSFILANGAVVNTEIVVVPKWIPEKTESFYDFTPKLSNVEQPKKRVGSDISDLELMKSMVRWDNVVGYQARKVSKWIKSGIKGLSAQLIYVYTGPKFNGYIFKIRNNTKKEYAIDVKSLNFGSPNTALLSQTDKKILGPKKSGTSTTYLRIVAKASSVYYNINLPVAPVITK